MVLGAQRESLVMSPDEKRATAFHEGGHALLATVLPHGDPLHKVTILPRGMALGVTWSLPQERHTYSKEYFEDIICKAMGGRVAEKLTFDHVNSGAANDLEQATSIARRMVREWGMSDRVGPMAWSSQQQVFLGEDLMSSGREYSDDTAKLLDEEIARILTQQEERASGLLTKHRRGLELIAESLLEHETIDGREVAKLIQQGMDESGDGDRVPMNILNPESEDLPTRTVHPPSRARVASAQSRTLAHGGPEVGGGDRAEERPAHHAVGVGDHHEGHGVDVVAVVELPIGRILDRRDRHLVARQHLHLAADVGAGVARLRREHGHQPRGVRPVEVRCGRAARAPAHAAGSGRRAAPGAAGPGPRPPPRRR